jgi:acyl-CoA thioester hydrolase
MGVSDVKLNSPFTYLIRVRFCECDAQGVVFNARYGDYVDTAVIEFFRVVLGGYDKLLIQGLDLKVVRLMTQWSSSAEFDDVLSVTVEAKRFGNTSYTLALGFNDYLSQRSVATSEITYVMVNADTQRKVTVPAGIKKRLSDGAPGVVVNHSGL